MLSSEQKQRIHSVLQVASGNFLEMYDFMVFGYFAQDIARAFFPSGNAFFSLMLSLMTFGAGFLMRPLGAIVLGSYMDEHGRRKGLLLTLGLMTIGTLSLTVTPSYSVIGVFAPLIVVAGRLLQGFSAGVELGGTSVYLAEIATPNRKGFYVSFQSASQQIAVIVAAAIGFFLNRLLKSDQMNEWGWRIPLAVGCLIGPLLFWLRRGLKETETFNKRKERPSQKEIINTLLLNWRIVLLGLMLVTMTTVSFYTITAYTPTYARQTLGLPSHLNLLVTLCIGVSNFILLPVMGMASDKWGRKPLLTFATVLTVLTAYPALLWLTADVSIQRLLIVELWLSFLYSSYNGAMVVYLIEMMPLKVRTSGFSLAYSFATATFGGFTPAICTYLIHTTGNPAVPGLWLTFAALSGLFAVYLTSHHEDAHL